MGSSEQERHPLDDQFPEVYDELHRLAVRCFRNNAPGHTLQPTALLHEAYLKLSVGAHWNDRNHFHCLAARAMRQILVNHARDRGRQKRGGGRQRVPLEDGVAVTADSAPELEVLDEALEELAAVDQRKAQVVELRYFGGLSVAETAAALDVSETTVKSDWTFAKAWLFQRIDAP